MRLDVKSEGTTVEVRASRRGSLQSWQDNELHEIYVVLIEGLALPGIKSMTRVNPHVLVVTFETEARAKENRSRVEAIIRAILPTF